MLSWIVPLEEPLEEWKSQTDRGLDRCMYTILEESDSDSDEGISPEASLSDMDELDVS